MSKSFARSSGQQDTTVNFASPLQLHANPYTYLLRKIASMSGPQSAFDNIKTMLTTAPVLGYPSTSGGHFSVDCDASNVGIGSVIHHMQNEKEIVKGYYSRCLSRAERKDCTTRKELLSVVEAVKLWHPYLIGQQFLIRSNHGSLQWLLNLKNGEGQFSVNTLSLYNLTRV